MATHLAARGAGVNVLKKTHMKLTVSPPISIGKTSYSTLDMVRYVVDTDRRYNGSAESARMGVRTVRAFEAGPSVEIGEPELRLLAEVLERPSRGWGSFRATRDVQQRQPDGSIAATSVAGPLTVPAREFLPLIDPITEAAAKLPALAKP